MSTNVEGYEILWDDEYVYLTFTDENGDGERLKFKRDQIVRVSEDLRVALIDMNEF